VGRGGRDLRLPPALEEIVLEGHRAGEAFWRPDLLKMKKKREKGLKGGIE